MEKLGYFIVIVVVILAAILLFAYPMMLLWNGCLVPAISGVHAVTYWQMVGLKLLFALLFANYSASKKD